MSEKLTKLLTPVVVLFFAAALGVTAATTIGTDIETEGTITADEGGTFGGDVTITATEDSLDGIIMDPNGNYFTVGGDTDLPYFQVDADDMTIFMDADADGTSELTLESGSATFDTACVLVRDLYYCEARSTNPYSCSGAEIGLYFDTDDGEFCFCDGTAWGPVDQSSAAVCASPE